MATSRLTRPRRRSPALLVLSVLMLVAATVLLVFELVEFTQRENRIPPGTRVAGVLVGNFTYAEAQAQWEQAYSSPVTLFYNNSPIVLNPDRIGFRVNSPTMLAQVTASSQAGGGFWSRFFSYLLGRTSITGQQIPLDADYQLTALRTYLESEIAPRYDRPGGRANYDLTTLTIFPGTAGQELDVNLAMTLIDQALRRPENRVVDLPLSTGRFSQANMETLGELIIDYLDSQNFIYDGQTSVASIFIMDLQTGEELRILSDVAFTAASTTKLGILMDYFRVLNGEPTQDDAWLMANSLLCSQNSTSNLIMSDIIGGGDIFRGIASVTNTLQQLGARNSFLTAPFVDGSANQQFGSIQAPRTSPNSNFNTAPDPFNQTTAEDLGTLFNLLYDCATYNSGLLATPLGNNYTQQECRRMLELMSGLELQRLIEGGVPTGTHISHKNGWFGEVTGNAGIVYPPNGRDYIISVFIWEDTGATGFQDYLRLWPIVEEISRATWNYFSPETPLLTRRTDLPPTAQECFRTEANGTRTNVYLPPYGQVNLDNINGWRN